MCVSHRIAHHLKGGPHVGIGMRLDRLFNRGENAVIVAVDHGEFDGPIKGMVNLPEVVKKINPAVDGILLSPGMLRHCRHAFDYRGAPLAVVRLNWSTVYCFQWKYREARTVQAVSAREAVALGADLVLVSLTLQTGSEETDSKNIEVFCRLCNEAHSLGVPVVGEFFPPAVDELSPEELHERVRVSCRIVAELGADLVKTFYTVDFKSVTRGCPIPILGLGAEKLPTQLDALKLAAREVRDGARGVVFGRNAIQVPDPFKFQAALCEVVKHRMSPSAAARKFGLKG